MAKIHSFESCGTVDGPGIRFVVFMQGCPMRCKYCHNPDTWASDAGKEYSAREVAEQALKYRRYFGARGGVTVSGGEPLLQLDFVIELFTLLKQSGVHTCLDTSGICFSEGDGRYKELLGVTDLFLLDIKHIGAEEHRALTGCPNTAPLAFARYLSEHKKPVWIRHVLVPELTDRDEFLYALRDFLGTLTNVEKTEILPYHTMGEVKYKNMGLKYPLAGVAPPNRERISNAERILCGKRR